MNINKSKIDIIPLLNTSWTIKLNESFRMKLKERIKEKFSIKSLSRITGKSIDSIWKFNEGKYNVTLSYLLKVCLLVDISKQELSANIQEIYPKVKKASFKLKEIEVNPLFTEWYGAWVGEGDHSLKRESISMTNYSVEILRLHIQVLINMGFEKDRIKAEIVSPYKEDTNNIKERWSKILNLPTNQITTVTYMQNAKQEGARVQIWCAGLFRILHQIKGEVRSIIKNSDNNIKVAYIQGIFAAEGSVRNKGKEIRLNMDDKEEVSFVKSILEDLEIKPRPIRLNKCNYSYSIAL